VATAEWSIIESRGRPGLESLEADWRRLYGQMPLRTSFLAYEAALARVERLPSQDKVRCLALWDGRQIRAICLLEPSRRCILRRRQKAWQVLWHDHGRQANALCPDDEAARRLVPALVTHLRREREGRHFLVLGPMPVSSTVWEGLRGIPRAGYYVEPRESVWLLDCRRPFDEVRASLPRHYRHVLNTARRRLSELRDVRYVTVTDPEDVEAEFEVFLEVEASGWKGDDGTRTALRSRSRQCAVFRGLVADLRGEDDRCEITSLYAEGHCMASQFATRTGATYSALKIGRDETYDRVSPGHLLLEKIVERCCEDPRIRRLDMVSDAAWVRGWRPEAVPLQLVYVVLAPRPAYPLVAALLRLRFGPGRRLVRRLRVAEGLGRGHVRRIEDEPRT
jgi:CelD/BcsL family acetyltransferase involved in cellulose biosynthesis